MKLFLLAMLLASASFSLWESVKLAEVEREFDAYLTRSAWYRQETERIITACAPTTRFTWTPQKKRSVLRRPKS